MTLREFIDPQCPYCQQFETQVLPTSSELRPTGKLQIQMQPWAFIGPDSVRGQAAELAAARQNKAFNYTAASTTTRDENTGWLNDGMVAAIASEHPRPESHALFTDRTSDQVKAAQHSRRQPCDDGERTHQHTDAVRRQDRGKRHTGEPHRPNRRSIGDSGNQRRVSLTHA